MSSVEKKPKALDGKKSPLTSQVAVCIMNQKVDAISVVAQWHIPPHTRWNSDPQSAGPHLRWQ